MGQFTGMIGVVVIIGIAWLLSSNRRAVNWRLVGAGVLLQMVLAVAVLRVPGIVDAFDGLARVVNKVISFADDGTRFLFGDRLTDPEGPWGFVFLVKVLPVIIFFAALMGVLFHLGIMQRVIAGVAWVLRRTLGITGAEALSASANVFVGQTEAPLCIRPYIAGMTRSQLMTLMVGGFSTIAGSVMAAYIGILGGEDVESRVLFAKHLMCASVLSAPGGIVIAKVLMPETERPPPETLSTLLNESRTTRNVLDAAAAGASDGLRLALNVAAMLVAFVALLAMLNYPLAAFSRLELIAAWRQEVGLPEFTFQNILGGLLKPLVWTFGVPWADCGRIGSLLGQQVIVTEFVAYLSLGDMIREGSISPRAAHMATYMLCGFANLPSIAIQIGGLSALAPERRADFAAIGFKAMVGGALACWMTGAVAGCFLAGGRG